MSNLIVILLQFYLWITISHSVNMTSLRSEYKFYDKIEGWIKIHWIPATWFDARLRCYLEGGVLASPLNEKMISVMKEQVKDVKCGLFTGVHATFSKGDYFSIKGIPLSEMPVSWAPDEPDNFNNEEQCLLMLPNGALADVNCSQVHPYICYKKNKHVTKKTYCNDGYEYFNLTEKCYKFHHEGMFWSRAYMTCAAEGGHLAIINSDIEAKVITELCAKYPPSKIPPTVQKDVVLLGFHDWGETGIFVTIHGESLEQAGYEQWASGQPNNMNSCGGQPCGGAFRNALLADLCCNHRYAFICEKNVNTPISN